MLEAIMTCSGENVVGPSELLDVSQSVELRCVYDFDQKMWECNVSMDGVIKHLKEKKREKTLLKLSVPLYQRGGVSINAEYRVYSFALCLTGVGIIFPQKEFVSANLNNSNFELSNHLLSLNIKLSVAK